MSGKCALVPEARGLRDFGERIIRGGEEVEGFVEAGFHDELARGDAEQSENEVVELVGGEFGHAG